MAFDGTEQLTPLADLLNAVVDAANAKIQAGNATIPITTANTPTTAVVNFPVAYATPPIVIVQVRTGDPSIRFASQSAVTTTGFTATGVNAVVAPLGIAWVAIGS